MRLNVLNLDFKAEVKLYRFGIRLKFDKRPKSYTFDKVVLNLEPENWNEVLNVTLVEYDCSIRKQELLLTPYNITKKHDGTFGFDFYQSYKNKRMKLKNKFTYLGQTNISYYVEIE